MSIVHCQLLRRFISVALVLKSPSAGVTRYPCPMEPGLSSQEAFRRILRGCSAYSRSYYTISYQRFANFANFPLKIIVYLKACALAVEITDKLGMLFFRELPAHSGYR